MLTQRDKDVLRFIETHKAISTQQAKKIYFEGLEVSTIRRLNQLEELKIIESYYVGKQKIYKYPEVKQLSQHDLYILDFIAWIYEQGGKVTQYKKTPHYLKGLLIPDAYIKFDLPYNNELYEITCLLEIDYKHYTDIENKLSVWYEKIFRENVIEEDCLIIICRPTKGIRYNSKNYETIYTDLHFTNLLQIIFN